MNGASILREMFETPHSLQRVKLANIRLVPATINHLDLEDISGAELARELKVAPPPSWPPEYNGAETRQWVRDELRAHPDASAWYSSYVIALVGASETLVGICGFKGPPDESSTVEIGYSIVPELQRRGLATGAVALLCDRAIAGGARVVTAETLPALIASQGVLLKSGFERFQTYQDAEAGEVWRYRRQAQLLRVSK